jgi:hypothetical protein
VTSFLARVSLSAGSRFMCAAIESQSRNPSTGCRDGRHRWRVIPDTDPV